MSQRGCCWKELEWRKQNSEKMDNLNFWQIVFIAFIPAILTAVVTYLINAHQIRKYKADSMAERSAKHFLKHKTFTDRSFKTIKKHLGGWDKDEDALRKILVRAGAVRVFREEEENKEWWYLLSRAAERIKKKESKRKQKKS